jgi:hypothetical protein
MIELIFQLVYAPDLGKGVTTSKSIGCVGITGISPVVGYNLNCTLFASTTDPKI